MAEALSRVSLPSSWARTRWRASAHSPFSYLPRWARRMADREWMGLFGGGRDRTSGWTGALYNLRSADNRLLLDGLDSGRDAGAVGK